MLSFRRYALREKVETFLRTPISHMTPGDYVPVSEFFPQKRTDDAICRRIWEMTDDELAGRLDTVGIAVDPRDLIPTQYSVESDKILSIVKKGGVDKPITIARHAGKYYIINGHHRAAADLQLKKPRIVVQAVDVASL